MRAARTVDGSNSIWFDAAQPYARRFASRSDAVHADALVTVAPTHAQPNE